MLLSGCWGDEHAGPAGERRKEAAVGLIERHGHRLWILDGHRLDKCQLAGTGRAELRVGHALEIVLHRFRIERCAVVEGYALANVEGKARAVFGNVPGVGDARYDLQVLVNL